MKIHQRLCNVEGCQREQFKKSFCSMHYSRWNRHGNVGGVEAIRSHGKICSVHGCKRKHYGKGFCEKHHSRFRRNGTPIKRDTESEYVGSLEHRAWRSMVNRVLDKNGDHWKFYGSKGIRVSARWRYNFLNFLKDMGEKPTPKHSIDRIDNRFGYHWWNCRWATWVEQGNNKTDNLIIKIGAKKKTISQWAREYGMSVSTFYNRIHRSGMAPYDALTQPIGRYTSIKGSQHKLSKLNEENVRTIKELIRNGVSNTQISRMYDVSDALISKIRRGLGWKHVA